MQEYLTKKKILEIRNRRKIMKITTTLILQNQTYGKEKKSKTRQRKCMHEYLAKKIKTKLGEIRNRIKITKITTTLIRHNETYRRKKKSKLDQVNIYMNILRKKKNQSS